MSDEKDEIYIGCITVKFGQWNPNSVVPGCVTKKCCSCSTDIHVSPQSQQFIASKPNEIHVICIQCMKKQNDERTKAGKDVHMMGAVPGAIEEALKQIDRIKRNEKE